MRKFSLQLYALTTGLAIAASGGTAYVTAADGVAKSVIYNAAGTAISNPIQLTNGKIEFYTADALQTVDLYVMSPTGHFVVAEDIKPGDSRIDVATWNTYQTAVIPFSIADTTATAETSTGFTIPATAEVLPFPAVYVVGTDATETIDVGTLSSASGDADGFLALASVATAGLVKGSLTVTHTLGALLKVQDSANAGDAVPEPSTASAGKVITYTLTAGTDTATGKISIPYRLVV
jgi:hypothetical protein